MNKHSESDSIFSNVNAQIFAAIIGNIIIFSHGCASGWVSPALPVLLSNNTPLSTGPLTNSELSWIGSMSSVGAVCGTFICGLLSALLGCKRAMAFLAFPTTIFWLLVCFGHTFYHLLIARFAAGLTGGGFYSGVTLYISEISNDNIRGRLGSITPLARNAGLLAIFSVSSIVDYKYQAYIFIWMPVVYLIWLISLPNTPQYYLQKEQFHKAEKALMYYKGCDGKSDHQKSMLNAEFERLKQLEEERRKRTKIQLKDFCNRMAFEAVITSISISWFLQMTGCYIITNYASIIFEKSGTVFGINVSSVILAVVQIIGGLVSTQMGDTFERKTTLSISLLGSAVGLLSFTVYLYMRYIGYDVSNYLWLPLVCLSLIIFITSAGMMALSSTCAVENFPSKIRNPGMVWYSLWNNSIGFIGDKFFPTLVELIHLHGVLIFLIINCCIGLVFVAFMKETKGKSLDSVVSNKKEPLSHEEKERF